MRADVIQPLRDSGPNVRPHDLRRFFSLLDSPSGSAGGGRAAPGGGRSDLGDRIEARLRRDIPEIKATIHVEPERKAKADAIVIDG